MNAFRTTLTTLTAVLATGSALGAPVTYTFDTTHSRVTFYVNHLGFSNSVGEFKVGAGTFSFDQADWAMSKADVHIAVRSLELGDPEWNGHILKPDWLDAEKFPEITFKSTGVQAGEANHGRLAGELTIKGVSKPVVLELTLNKSGEHFLRKTQAVGFTARTKVKRSEFGVIPYLPAVGDELDVRIEIEAYVATPDQH